MENNTFLQNACSVPNTLLEQMVDFIHCVLGVLSNLDEFNPRTKPAFLFVW